MKKILLVHHPGTAFNNPTLQSFIQYALSSSTEIDIRCRPSMAPKPEFNNLNWLKYGRLFSRIKTLFLKQFSSETMIWFISMLEMLFVFKKKYDLIIGVDREGLIDAGHYSRFLKIPYVFFSFEILFADEIGYKKKKLEKKYSEGLCLWLVQDEIRAARLIEENDLNPEDRFICPVASAGKRELNPSRLRDSLGIDKSKKAAIMIGSLTGWSMAGEIIQTVESWPNDWVLIIHERYGRTSRMLRDKKGADLLGTRIFCSDSYTVSLDDMGTILAGVDAGIAFYRPVYTTPYNGKNIKYLGLSSGKIATYLRYGIPIISNNIGEYSRIIVEKHLGEVLEDPNQIGAVLGRINGAEYSARCKKYFSEYLDADLYMPLLYKKLMSIIEKNPKEHK